MFYYITDPASGYGFQIDGSYFYAIIGVALAISIALYVLRSIGVYTLAKRKEIKCAYFGWIPILWTYAIGKVVGKANIFGGKKIELALPLCIIYGATQLFAFGYYFLSYYPLISYLLGGDAVVYMGNLSLDFIKANGLFDYDGTMALGANFVNPYSSGIRTLGIVVSIVSSVLDLANIVFMVTMYFALFRRFWPAHHWAAGIFSIFGLFGIFVFVVRNKRETNYEEYVRSIYGNQYGGGFYGPYNPNAYNGQNPNGQYGNGYGYGANPSQGAPQDEPFGEFKQKQNKPEEPFGEFEQKPNKPEEPFGEFDKDREDK